MRLSTINPGLAGSLKGRLLEMVDDSKASPLPTVVRLALSERGLDIIADCATVHRWTMRDTILCLLKGQVLQTLGHMRRIRLVPLPAEGDTDHGRTPRPSAEG